ICHGNLCCNFALTVNNFAPSSSLQYKAVVFDGKRTAAATKNAQYGLQVCGVVLCANDSIASCGSPAVNGILPNYNVTLGTKVTFTNISIDGNFISDNANPLPNVLIWPRNPSMPQVPGSFLINTKDVKFTTNSSTSSIEVITQNQIITVGIQNRVFSRDPGNGAPMTHVSLFIVLLSAVPFLIR
ncbi:hypothetical protein GE061_002576, partial [Apolygus lucorum]